MKTVKRKLFMVAGVVVVSIVIAFSIGEEIPITWDIEAIKKMHLPPPDSSAEVVYASEAYYNALPEHVIYKTYPVYLREFEPIGYLDSLRQLKPEIAFDLTKIKKQQDWIEAGKIVFNWPVASYRVIKDSVSLLSADNFDRSKTKITKDGVYLFNRYFLNEKGDLVRGSLSCASCHTRVMDSGEIIEGAPGNTFNSEGFARAVQSQKIPFSFLQQGQKQLYYTPWAPDSIRFLPADPDEFASSLRVAPAGVDGRQGGGYLYPFKIPSLIGIKGIKYFDHTGLMRHDGPGDLMRYAAFNQGMDMFTSYNGFVPGGKNDNTTLPLPTEWNHPFGYEGKKYSDAQLYALTQYIYSLTPPENPNHFSKELIQSGEQVFKIAGCVSCHTPPLYTNNKLTPVNGFEPPAEHFKKYDIFNVSVETDSVNALYTRRGTGYYKVPSLRGLWYQNAFFHNGNLATLEEVFDPKRLRDDYVPRGYKPPYVKTMAVKGHPFGMSLSDSDKKALIAFLKTL